VRVIHVITRLIVGGAQENTVASVLGLRSRPGFEVSLVAGGWTAAEGSLAPLFAPCPHLLMPLPSLVRPLHPWHDPLAWAKLKRLFRQERPDLVHTHSGKAGVLGRLAARAAGVPLIVHTIHGPSFGAFQGCLANTLFRAAERRAARCTTHFVSVADAMTRQYLAAGIGRPDQFTRIYSGFDLRPFLEAGNDPALRARHGLGPGDLVLGKIARCFKLKGYEDLLAVAPDLLEACPRMKLLLVGDGPWRNRYEARVRDLGLADRCVFTGLVPPDRVPSLVGIMDILVHLSRREGLPRALPQALAVARPVVAYDCDGAGEVCLDGTTGYLVRPGDRTQLKQRLIDLARDAGLRDRLGRQGRELVRPRFALETMVDQLQDLYLELARRHRQGRQA
jgi:glycosyltransferase involved in cell wall biosynthesis